MTDTASNIAIPRKQRLMIENHEATAVKLVLFKGKHDLKSGGNHGEPCTLKIPEEMTTISNLDRAHGSREQEMDADSSTVHEDIPACPAVARFGERLASFLGKKGNAYKSMRYTYVKRTTSQFTSIVERKTRINYLFMHRASINSILGITRYFRKGFVKITTDHEEKRISRSTRHGLDPYSF